MKFISHRGNISGPIINYENNPDYIVAALKLGYDVEIDVRFFDSFFYLGHDKRQYKVNHEFLEKKGIWCHAKNFEALEKLQKLNCIYFWHENDDYTLTSNGYIWTFPKKKLLEKSICVLPEKSNYKLIKCYGICSDYIMKYKIMTQDNRKKKFNDKSYHI